MCKLKSSVLFIIFAIVLPATFSLTPFMGTSLAEPGSVREQNDNNTGQQGETSSPAVLPGSVTSVAAKYVDKEKSRSNTIIQEYQVNRLSFLHKQKKLDQIVLNESKIIDGKIETLAVQVEQAGSVNRADKTFQKPALPGELTKTLQNLDEKISQNETFLQIIRIGEIASSIFLFPEFLLFFALFGAMMTFYAPAFGAFMIPLGSFITPETQHGYIFLLYLGIPAIVVNFFIFLFYRHNEIFLRHKKSIFCCTAVLLLSSFISIITSFGGNITGTLVQLSFFVLAIYGAIFFSIRKKDLLYRHKYPLIIGMVLLLMLCATSLIAGQNEKINKVEERLDYTVQLLGLSDYAKAVAMLEARMNTTIPLPDNLSPGDPLLSLSTTVTLDTPEYYITLASLYVHGNDTRRATGTLAKLSSTEAEQRGNSLTAIVNAVRFLVTNNHKNIAASILDAHQQQITSVPLLLDLIPFLESYSMPASSEKLLTLAVKKADTTADYLLLVHYFQENFKQDKVELYLQKSWKRAKTIDEILQVLRIAEKNKLSDKMKKVDKKIARFRGTVPELLQLADFLEQRGKSDQASLLLLRSIRQAGNSADMQKLTLTVIELDHDEVFPQIRDRVLRILNQEEQITFVDFLLKQQRQEDGSTLFSAIAKKALHKSNHPTEDTLLFIRLAVQRKLLEQASQLAIQRISGLKAKSFHVFVPMTYPFAASEGLPDPEQISLPLFYGLLNEELGRYDKSEQMYLSAVLRTLNSVVSSSGENLPKSLNEFYLLGRMWIKGGKTGLLAKLDRAYSILEANVLKERLQQKRNEILGSRQEKLTALEQQLKRIKARNNKLLQQNQEQDAQLELRQEAQLAERIHKAEKEIEEKQIRLQDTGSKLHRLIPGSILLISTIILLIIGCFVLSWQHAQKHSRQKMYAGTIRFIELNGWIRIFSILGAISGFFIVCAAQLWQFPQRISENTRRRKTDEPPSTDSSL